MFQFVNLALDFNCNSFLHSSLMEFIATNLREEFHIAKGASLKVSLVESLVEVFIFALLDGVLSVFLPCFKD